MPIYLLYGPCIASKCLQRLNILSIQDPKSDNNYNSIFWSQLAQIVKERERESKRDRERERERKGGGAKGRQAGRNIHSSGSQVFIFNEILNKAHKMQAHNADSDGD